MVLALAQRTETRSAYEIIPTSLSIQTAIPHAEPTAVPFGLVASLEVAQTSQIAVYEEVSARIRPHVEIVAG